MRAAVALLISVSLFAGACFPNNKRHQMYAKLAEGGALVAGIGMLYVVNSGADCDMMAAPGGEPDEDCKSRASVLGTVGLGLILVGLVGFIATVSTSEDDKLVTPATTAPKAEPPSTSPPAEPTPEPTPTPAPVATDPPATPPTEPTPAPATP
ncbi:MAG: hypothetical protein H0T46_07020 [Deltaproteobacteria bacterium]|nr:hypothetical protein [Deltaproteobacteria bacterium]